MTNNLSAIADVRKGGLFKYVRMTSGSVSFASFDLPWIPAHCDMVAEDETPYSAGTAKIADKDVRITQPGSTTIGINSAADDEKFIAQFLWPVKKAKRSPAKRATVAKKGGKKAPKKMA